MRYSFSNNGENYHGDCDSREAAIAEGIEYFGIEVGNTVYTGEINKPLASRFAPDEDDVTEIMCLRADDNAGEASEDWLRDIPKEASEELTADLAKLVDAWATKHKLQPAFWLVTEVQEHVVTQADLEDEPGVAPEATPEAVPINQI